MTRPEGESSVSLFHPKTEHSEEHSPTQPEVREKDSDLAQDLKDLAIKVRQNPGVARDLTLFYLVRKLSERWRFIRDLQLVSEEAPVTAWIIRRKSDLVLPQKEPEPEPQTSENIGPRDDRFLRKAVDVLQNLRIKSQGLYSRPVSVKPCGYYHPVKGAEAKKLVKAWPKLRQRPTPVLPRVIKAETDPLDVKISQFLDRLYDYGRPMSFDMAVEKKNPQDTGATFLAMIHLWHQNRVELNQEKPYDAIWITLQTPNPGGEN